MILITTLKTVAFLKVTFFGGHIIHLSLEYTKIEKLYGSEYLSNKLLSAEPVSFIFSVSIKSTLNYNFYLFIYLFLWEWNQLKKMTPPKETPKDRINYSEKNKKKYLVQDLWFAMWKTVSRTTLGINNIQDDLLKDCISKKKSQKRM